MFRRRCIQLCFSGPASFGKLRVIPTADAGDECARRNGLAATRDRFLELSNGKSPLDASRFISGIHTCARVVDVGVPKAGNDSASSEIDGLATRAKRRCLSDIQDAAVL